MTPDPPHRPTWPDLCSCALIHDMPGLTAFQAYNAGADWTFDVDCHHCDHGERLPTYPMRYVMLVLDPPDAEESPLLNSTIPVNIKTFPYTTFSALLKWKGETLTSLFEKLAAYQATIDAMNAEPPTTPAGTLTKEEWLKKMGAPYA